LIAGCHSVRPGACSDAGQAAQKASDELTALERERLEVDEARAAMVTCAAQKVAKARARVAEPWPERRRAADAVAGDRQGAATRYVVDHAEELIAEVEAEGRAAAESLTDAAAFLAEAHRHRGAVERRLVNVVHHTFPANDRDLEMLSQLLSRASARWRVRVAPAEPRGRAPAGGAAGGRAPRPTLELGPR
jgi:hypothetical protein